MQKAMQLRNCDFVWLHLVATVEFFIVENLHPVMIVIHIKCVMLQICLFLFLLNFITLYALKFITSLKMVLLNKQIWPAYKRI